MTIGHVRILTVVLETSKKDRLMWGNLFKRKLFPPHEPPSLARSSPTVRIRIRSIGSNRREIILFHKASPIP